MSSHSTPPADLVPKQIDFDENQEETMPLLTIEAKTELEVRVEQFEAM